MRTTLIVKCLRIESFPSQFECPGPQVVTVDRTGIISVWALQGTFVEVKRNDKIIVVFGTWESEVLV